MTKREYSDYKAAVERFFEKEGIQNLTGLSGETYFSNSRCDCCNRPFGGDREDCNGYNPITKEIQEGYSICSDCVHYAEYGELDDTTMMDMGES